MEVNNSINDVRETLKGWCQEIGLTQTEVARKINKSPSAISQFLAGKYDGNNQELANDIAALMVRESHRKQENVTIPICLTENIKDVLAVCGIVHQSRVMGLLHGGSGFGKTTGLKYYMEKHNQSVMITAYAGITVGSLLAMLLRLISPKHLLNRNLGFVMDAIMNELAGKDTLIIIDEAHFLGYKHFERIRAIHDTVVCPVIFSGNDEIIDRMTGAQQFDYDRFYSRVPIVKNIAGKITKEDVSKILEALKVKDDGNILRFLEKKVNEQGHYRKIKHLLANAIRFARKDQSDLTMGHLQAAEQLLLGKRYSALAN